MGEQQHLSKPLVECKLGHPGVWYSVFLARLEKMVGKVGELPAETQPKQLEDSPKPRKLRSFLAGRVGRNYRTHPLPIEP